ncbi:MAG: hypothetical protein QOF27_350 [Gaiellaceae bacterium]|jgi:hypothetical protein|nr:hypothetical protein [Gaiellaceae bacterium]
MRDGFTNSYYGLWGGDEGTVVGFSPHVVVVDFSGAPRATRLHDPDEIRRVATSVICLEVVSPAPE